VPSQDVPQRKFRHSAAITVAAVVAFFGTAPLATSRLYLLPLFLVPVAVGVWAWRSGTDVTATGLRIRALFASRRIPWSHVAALVPDGLRAYAVLTTGRRVRLPAVSAANLATIATPPTDDDADDAEGTDAGPSAQTTQEAAETAGNTPAQS
jgi:hypothetical protein